MTRLVMGEPEEASPERSCATCALSDACRDPRKSRRFACTLHVRADDAEHRDADESSRDFLAWMRQLVRKESVLSDPYAVDDSALDTAENFYQWCMDPRFLNAEPRPFPWQLEVGIHLFGDACPWCSSREWYREIPFDCDPQEIPEHLQLRRDGVCPRCRRSVLDGIREGREHDVNTFVGVVGQRCVTGETLLLTSRGIVRIGDYAPVGTKTGWTSNDFRVRTPQHWRHNGRRATLEPVLESGSIVRANNFWVSSPEYVRTVSLRGGMYIRGTDDHPIMLTDGWTTLRRVKVADYSPVRIGQDVWGRCERVKSEDQARALGFWVSEGSGGRRAFHVTNYDHDVLRLCACEIRKISATAILAFGIRAGTLPEQKLKRCVGTRDTLVFSTMDDLLDGLWRKSADKVIPRSILEAPKKIVAAFLQALFEGDGGVGRNGVEYASLSRTLIDQLRVVLANMGIVTHTRRRMSWATNGSPLQISKPYWCLSIRGRFIAKFQQEVGFFSQQKRLKLLLAVRHDAQLESDQPHWFDRYPAFVKHEYIDLILRADAEWTGVRRVTEGKNPHALVTFRYLVADWRRLFSKNVCLSRSRVANYRRQLLRLPQWRDLSVALRTEFLAFWDRHLDPNLVWMEVTGNRRSAFKHVTYDVHVPGHHRFMANGILNHNSGKCVHEDELVSTARGLVPIKDVLAGDEVVVAGVRHPVTRTWRTRSKKVRRYTTERGYSVAVTPEHLVKSPDGWERAERATFMLIRAESATRMPPDRWRRLGTTVSFARAVACAPEHVAVQLVKSVVSGESYSGTSLVLRISREIEGLQRGLLSMGLLSIRPRSHPDRLVLEQPWAARYARVVGIRSRSIAYHVIKSRSVTATRVGEAACSHLARLILQQGINELSIHPLSSRAAHELYAACASKSLTRAEAARGARLMRSLPYSEFFLRNLLVEALQSASSATAHWDLVVSSKPAGRTTVYDLEVPSARRFVVGGIEVHNSTGTALPLSYHTHRLLKIKNPSEFYGIKRGQVLTTSIVGITYGGAKQNVWDPLLDSISNSPWFSEYHRMLDDVARSRGTEELYRLKDTFLMYRHAGLYTSPCSPSRRSLRGKTRIGAVVDELGHFSEKSQMVNISGLAIWDALANSMMTVRGAFRQRRREGVKSIPPAVMIGISSPWDVGDPIMILRKQSMAKKSAYVVLRPTWEANPNLTFDFLDDETPDKVTLWRDFGCRPPLSENAFIHGHEPLVAAVLPGNSLPAARQKTVAMTGAGGKRSFVSARLSWRWTDEVPTVLALDAGRSNNSFAAAVAHLSPDGEVVYDAMFEIRPGASRPVSYEATYRDVLSGAIQRLGVRIVSSDRWQNYAVGDRAEQDHGVRVLECRLKYGDFVAFRDDLLRGAVRIPRPETTFEEILNVGEDEANSLIDQPVAQFIRQCVRVIDVPGKTVDKPSTGSDDVFRAAVVAHHTLRLPEVAKFLGSGSGRRKSAGALGAVATASTARPHTAASGVGVYSGTRLVAEPAEVVVAGPTRVYLPRR